MAQNAGQTQRSSITQHEDLKRLLRQAYRKSQLAWQAYRDADNPIDKAIWKRQARDLSAAIHIISQPLGYAAASSIYDRKRSVWSAVDARESVLHRSSLFNEVRQA